MQFFSSGLQRIFRWVSLHSTQPTQSSLTPDIQLKAYRPLQVYTFFTKQSAR
ncbi:MAG: hypothetical protein ACJAVX_000652 [Pseudoalteromonas rhizosphaerae]|jgi:hypothetical protein